MSNVPQMKNEQSAASILIPVFAAVALIITAAVYIVFKLTQQTTSKKWVEKWSDYDECGWS